MHTTHDAHRAGPAAPERPISDERPAVAAAQEFRDQNSGPLNSAARAERDQRDKAIATARARAAPAGFTMHLIESDAGRPVFLVTKWHLTRELPDLAAVSAFLDQAGARDA